MTETLVSVKTPRTRIYFFDEHELTKAFKQPTMISYPGGNMGRFLVFGLATLVYGATWAAPGYSISFDINMTGKKIASHTVNLKEGGTHTVLQDTSKGKVFIEISATQEKTLSEKIGARIYFIIGKVAANGVKSRLTRTQIVTFPNEVSVVASRDEKDQEFLSLSVKYAKRNVQ